jgi:peptide deformylase
MAVLPIRITGDPVLHSPAVAIDTIDDSVRALVADMFDTMEQAPGVGLAAPQVGVALRVFVFDWTDEDGERWRGTAINPELLISPVPIGDADEDDESEGCLSIPSERYPLRRAERAVLRATGLDGKPFEVDAHGWLARIFQHEYDHLEGVLYADRLEHEYRADLAKVIRKQRWGVAGNSWTPGVDDIDA